MNIQTLSDMAPWEWPENADRIILNVLRNPDASEEDRILALQLGGDCVVIDDTIADLALEVLKNRDETLDLRSQAAVALAPALEYADMMEFDDPDDILITKEMFNKVQETMRDTFNDTSGPKELRRRILEASVHAPQQWHKKAIETAYESGDDDWKLTAVFGMGHAQGFKEQILDSLNNEKFEIYLEAIFAAGNCEITEAGPHILELLRDEELDKDLRTTAIIASATTCATEAEEILLELADSEDEDIADAANEAIAMSGLLFDDDDFIDDADEGEPLDEGM